MSSIHTPPPPPLVARFIWYNNLNLLLVNTYKFIPTQSFITRKSCLRGCLRMCYERGYNMVVASHISLQRRHLSIRASQVTNYATTCSGQYKKTHQRSALLAFCEGNPLVTGGFSSQRASYLGSVTIPWLHYVERFGVHMLQSIKDARG